MARLLFRAISTATICAAVLSSAPLFERAAYGADTWKFYFHQTTFFLGSARGAKRLTEEIEKVTNGELKMQLFLAGTLQINVSDMAQVVGQNIVQFGDDLYSSGNIPVAGIGRLPMLVHSYAENAKMVEILNPYVEKAYAQKGSVLLGSYTYPSQVVWTARKKIGSLEDISGLKLRVSNPEQGEFLRRFHGTSITMGAPQVPAALDRGIMDGVITAGIGALLWKEQLKHGYTMEINYNNSYIIANADAFAKLSPDVQAKLRKVVADTARWIEQTMKTDEEASEKTLTEAGYVIVHPKPEELLKAAGTMRSYWDEWAKSRGPETEEVLAKVRAALGR